MKDHVLIKSIRNLAAPVLRIPIPVMAVLSGVTITLALPPLPVWPALFIGFGWFYILWAKADTPARAAFLSWLFGFGYFAAGLYWIGNALLVEGNDYAWAWPLAVFGLPALLALYYAAAGFFAFKFHDSRKVSGFLFFVLCFSLAEWLRGTLLTGFPWNLFGYGWHSVLPIGQLVSVGGTYWLTALTILWGAGAGFIFVWTAGKRAKYIFLAFILLSLALSCAFGAYRLQTHPLKRHDELIIRLVQPNIAQKDKWNYEKANENLREMLMLSRAEPANAYIPTIIIWPETALAYYLTGNENTATMIRRFTGTYAKTVYIASGNLKKNNNGDYYNSLTYFDRHVEEIENYNKSHLVPFGEYIPFQTLIPLKTVTNFQGFRPGEGPANIKIDQIGTFSPLICYEIIFPGKVINRNLQRPDWILNVTNDAWYGNSSGPYQHFTKARFRAIEEGIPVIRSANTGVSGMIGPLGRIDHEIKLEERGFTNSFPPSKIENATVFARFPGFVLMFTLAAIAALSIILRKKPY